MNTPPTAPRKLDSFESALLTELRAHVADRPLPETVPEPTRSRPHYRRWAAGLAVAAAAATAFVVGSPGGPAVNAAFAVTQEADGDVVATIHELEDAAGLEAALRAAGIDAHVSYETIPARAQEAADELPNEFGPYAVPDELYEWVPADGSGPDCAAEFPFTNVLSFTHEGGDYVLRIPADSVLQDRPIAITTQASSDVQAFFAGDRPGQICGVIAD